ncbi:MULTISPECIES: hypothetical protein [unclassified Polaribacter]|uniref:hypothetical protein n=1 Tax=unclassified Polaribacter TaxID=196858 RepID=UPI0011BE434B|nr:MULTISPECIES: hypothetical protein [unclassified Polaribacter]TXD54131.1 hypothetical protein ES043_01140 [Polaribacter sp. IC063]TXD62396.1 hypothetical protein ES044_01350 [Polaribacter sp. IC066]
MESSQIILQISLLVDAGLVVLIWMVQLIIYPSFTYYKTENLLEWHQKYTSRIAVVVVPLMLVQLVLAITDVFLNFSTQTVSVLAVVLFLWIFTFLSFAPLHFKISEGKHNQKILQQLIQRNWIRTFLWSALLLFHITCYISLL